uniref:Peptidase A2 domain-containing protein n=1 Tax=Cacopsylla melanoneura TaxID=428564 RepID=A0A8D8YVN3_9HEMI
MRMLLDSGSQSQFLSQAAVKELGLKVDKVPASVRGISGTTSSVRGTTNFTFSSLLVNNPKPITTEAYVVNQILDKLPSCQLDPKYLGHLVGLPLADSEFHIPGAVHGIIGANLFAQLIEPGKVTGSTQSPIAIKTSLGFVILGTAPVLSNKVDEAQISKNLVAIFSPGSNTNI